MLSRATDRKLTASGAAEHVVGSEQVKAAAVCNDAVLHCTALRCAALRCTALHSTITTRSSSLSRRVLRSLQGPPACSLNVVSVVT
jgi:phosphohistidine phosphatase SixA